jgi:hypothetical protein
MAAFPSKSLIALASFSSSSFVSDQLDTCFACQAAVSAKCTASPVIALAPIAVR